MPLKRDLGVNEVSVDGFNHPCILVEIAKKSPHCADSFRSPGRFYLPARRALGRVSQISGMFTLSGALPAVALDH